MVQIWTPLNPASREDENLEGFKAKEAPLGRIGQVSAPTGRLVSGFGCWLINPALLMSNAAQLAAQQAAS